VVKEITMDSAEMETLKHICLTQLDNADVDVGLDGITGVIRLDFAVTQYTHDVIFECEDFYLFYVEKAAEDNQALFVGETIVERIENQIDIQRILDASNYGRPARYPATLYEVRVLGGVAIRILCRDFRYSIVPASRPSTSGQQ
jgi:hypothetical protein